MVAEYLLIEVKKKDKLRISSSSSVSNTVAVRRYLNLFLASSKLSDTK